MTMPGSPWDTSPAPPTSWKSRAALFVVFGVAVGISASATVFGLRETHDRAAFSLDLLRLLLDWPPLVTVLLVALGLRFHAELGRLIDRIVHGKLPGGAEFDAPYPPQAPAPSEQEEPPPATDAEVENLRSEIEALRQNIGVSEAQRLATLEDAGRSITERRAQAIHWWFEYLNLFLTPFTQAVLRFLLANPRASLAPFGASPESIAASLQALQYHQLIRIEEGMFVATQAGADFLAHVDRFHPAPPPQPPMPPAAMPISTFARQSGEG